MRRWVLPALVVAALVRSLALGLVIPPYQSSDEPWHLDYARALADGTFPVLGETEIDPRIVEHDLAVTSERGLTLYGIDDPAMSREAFQPPLGYVVPAAVYAAVGRDPALGLAGFRAWNALLGGLAVIAAWRLGTAAFPSRRSAAVLAAVGAVALPGAAVVASTANNDALAVTLALVTLSVAVDVAREGFDVRRLLVLGGLVGTATWTKGSGALLVVPVVVAIALAPAARRARATGAVIATATAAAVAAPWLIRNVSVYGDLTGTSAFASFGAAPARSMGGLPVLLGRRPTNPAAGPFWPDLARSTVGTLGWSDLRLPALAYALALLAGACGLALAARHLVRAEGNADRRAAAVVAAAGAALLAGIAWFAYAVDYQPQGRYLIPATLAGLAVVGAALRRTGALFATCVLATLLGATLSTAVGRFGLP